MFLSEYACHAQLHAVRGSHTAIPTTIIGPIIHSTLHLLSKFARHLDEQPDTRLATQIHDHTPYVRPGYNAAQVADVALLQTCQRVYIESMPS